MVVGRNDPCPCGSGKKYKKCHGLIEEAAAARVMPRVGRRAPVLEADEIEGMRRAGRLAATVLHEACARVRPGVTTNEIDRWVHEMTLEAGAYPAPLNYPHPHTDPRSPIIRPKGFPKSVCTSINDVVCHGIPDETVLREGDIVNVDVTCHLGGFHGDTSRTLYVGEVSEEARNVTEGARLALEAAIARVRHGALFFEIGDAIESVAAERRLSVVRDFTGHGIGRAFHEPPPVLHYRDPSARYPMQAGQCFTIEPMLNVGTHRVRISATDHWTARTIDGSLSAQFEHTLLVTDTACEVLTQAPAA